MKKMKKKIATMLFGLGLAVTLTSCYSTTTAVGNLDVNTPMVKANTVKNHFLLVGLVPISNNQMPDSKYIGEAKNYKVKKSITFVDGLLRSITFGIYTPSTTTYYLPLDQNNR